jgi:tetratricopeptide (TPR) repeat protein
MACFCFPLLPQQLSLTGRVVDEDNEGLKNVTVRAQNFGEDTTGPSGEFSISLPTTIKPGTVIAVYVRPKEWVLKDFPDGYVTVRRDDMPHLTLRLARRGSLSLLTDARIRRLLEQSTMQAPPISSSGQAGVQTPPISNSAQASVQTPPISNSGQASALDTLVLQKASELGLSPSVVREGIENWIQHKAGTTAHDRGLAALYQGNSRVAIREWEASAALKEADLAETYTLLGDAELLQLNLLRAGSWFHKALMLKPTDSPTLFGMACVCAGLPRLDVILEAEKAAVGCQHEPEQYLDEAIIQLRLETPRSYMLEALLLIARAGLHDYLSHPGKDEGEREWTDLVAKLNELTKQARVAGPVEQALVLAMLGDLFLAGERYSEAEHQFDAALGLARQQPALFDEISLMIELPRANSYLARDMVARALGGYRRALTHCRKMELYDPGRAREFESEIHRLIAEAHIHVPAAATSELFPKDSERKAWYARKAQELFKQVGAKRQDLFREECELAVAVADGSAQPQYQSH